MSDDFQPDTPSDELQAVSAALDGTATVDERALIDASPELGQLLAELEGARQSMVDVQVPSQAREAGIAAALAAFDDQHRAPTAAAAAAVMPATPSNVVAFERKKKFYRTITAAAAAVVLLVVGIAALSSSGGSDDDQASSAVVATDDMSATKMEAPAETASPEQADAPAPLVAADTTAQDAAGTAQTDAAEAPAAEETAAPAETDSPSSTIGTIGGPGDVTPTIPDEQSLRAYVADASTSLADNECVPAGDENLGDISYQGTPAVVGRDPDTGEVLVYGTADCTVLATLPS